MATAQRCPACPLRSRGARARRSAHREEWDCGDLCRETRRRPRVPVYRYSITVAGNSQAPADVPDSRTTQRGEPMSEKKAFLDAWEREAATTVKVLRAFPTGKENMKPHATCRSAQELAWTFAFEGVAATQALQGEFKFPPANMPAMPDTWQGT